MRCLSAALALAIVLVGCDHSDSDAPPAAPRSFVVEVANVGTAHPVVKSGVFDTAVGAPSAGPLMPGQSFSFSFTAGPVVVPGMDLRLSLATMFAQSNDLYYAFPPEGLALYDASGNARTGDVTAVLGLYDAGTEVNEAPGLGPNQAPRQGPPDTGPAEGGVVTAFPDGGTGPDGFIYPADADVIRVTLAHDGGTGFTVTIENVGGAQVNGQDVLLSPGAWAVHTSAVALHRTGEAASEGIERIAEDGNPMSAGAALGQMTGITVPLSPGVWAVHSSAARLHEVSEAASEGVERIAEDGMPSALAAALAGASGVFSSGAFARPVGASADGPIGPGEAYRFTVTARPGERLSLATMYVQSNDLYFAFAPEGLALFDGATPVSGDVTAAIGLYDAGTEGDEEPGVGRNQAPRQSAPGTGPAGEGAVAAVGGSNDGHDYPAPSAIVRVTITPQ